MSKPAHKIKFEINLEMIAAFIDDNKMNIDQVLQIKDFSPDKIEKALAELGRQVINLSSEASHKQFHFIAGPDNKNTVNFIEYFIKLFAEDFNIEQYKFIYNLVNNIYKKINEHVTKLEIENKNLSNGLIITLTEKCIFAMLSTLFSFYTDINKGTIIIDELKKLKIYLDNCKIFCQTFFRVIIAYGIEGYLKQYPFDDNPQKHFGFEILEEVDQILIFKKNEQRELDKKQSDQFFKRVTVFVKNLKHLNNVIFLFEIAEHHWSQYKYPDFLTRSLMTHHNFTPTWRKLINYLQNKLIALMVNMDKSRLETELSLVRDRSSFQSLIEIPPKTKEIYTHQREPVSTCFLVYYTLSISLNRKCEDFDEMQELYQKNLLLS